MVSHQLDVEPGVLHDVKVHGADLGVEGIEVELVVAGEVGVVLLVPSDRTLLAAVDPGCMELR